MDQTDQKSQSNHRRYELAKKLFAEGYSCAQSVLYTHGKDYFKDPESALKLASSFRAGISYRGEMCGAVSGALMAIGLYYGYSTVNDDLAKEMNYRLSNEFLETFENQHGSVICNRLLNVEINTPEGLEYARANNAFEKCPALVENASQILDSLLEKYPRKSSAKTITE